MKNLGHFYCPSIQNNSQLIEKSLSIPWTCQQSKSASKICSKYPFLKYNILNKRFFRHSKIQHKIKEIIPDFHSHFVFLVHCRYKSRDDFIADVRLIFDNCEMFNEDDSPVGKAGHSLRKFFEARWVDLTDKHS